MPKLTFPGGMLVGCSAGFLNVPKIKGSHTAMKSGMLAAEAAFAAVNALPPAEDPAEDADEDEMPPPFTGPVADLGSYQEAFDASWVHDELKSVRNMRPSAHMGLGMYGAFLYAGAPPPAPPRPPARAARVRPARPRPVPVPVPTRHRRPRPQAWCITSPAAASRSRSRTAAPTTRGSSRRPSARRSSTRSPTASSPSTSSRRWR